MAQKLIGEQLPLYKGGQTCDSLDTRALARELEQEPLTVLALGPLTNIARVISCRPDLVGRITQVVFVGSRQPGEKFVVNASWPLNFLKPVLRDLNVESNIEAARIVTESNVDVMYVPFEAGKSVQLTYGEIAGSHATLPDWVLERTRDWAATQSFFLGSNGLLPFDLVAVIALTDQGEHLFNCEPVQTELVANQLIAEVAQGAEGSEQVCRPSDAKAVKTAILSALR